MYQKSPWAALLALLLAWVPLAGGVESHTTADHTKFEQLKRGFKTGPDVTGACLECHTEAAKQIHTTKHWQWSYVNPLTGQKLGKRHTINNFCTAVATNETFCAGCHVGYGMQDANFDFSSEHNVDCLVCHDTTGTYKKLPGLSGHPNYQAMEWPPHSGQVRPATDLKNIAQHVGKTSRDTCGACHFNGGGGNAVKHGDLDMSLSKPGRYLDVHMDADGLNFACSTCHNDGAHDVAGSRYHPTAVDDHGILKRGEQGHRNPATCQACHGNQPHKQARLNLHVHKLACQTCHVPAYARGDFPTKMSWDWSTAGKVDEKGAPIKVTDSSGMIAYDSKKGDFTYDRYVIPEYRWFNGKVNYTLFGDKVEPGQYVKINRFEGGPGEADSRIWPTKVFHGKQPIDVGHQTLAVFHTAGEDEAAFWTHFNWEKAMKAGMASTGKEYSGKMAFVTTEMSWPITHMVAPKGDALACEQCHSKHGRLQGIEGVYMPGRENTPWLDQLALLAALMSLIGVVIHGGIRLIAHRRRASHG